MKNRQRFNFGVIYPEAYSRAEDGGDACEMQTECLVQGDAARPARGDGPLSPPVRAAAGRAGASPSWQEAVERDITVLSASRSRELVDRSAIRCAFAFPAHDAAWAGSSALDGPSRR